MYTKYSNLKTLINVNTKFRAAKKSHFSHYCNISDQPVGSLEIFNSQSFFSRLILLVSNKLGTKKASLRDAQSGKNSGILRRFSVQNIKNQLFHQVTRRRICVVYTLTFGINFPNFGNYLQRFHSGVISHAGHIVLDSPY